ncbi:MAG TPA: hypothetical protein VGJ87_14650 [Roseiflexaceae bacterium]
MSTVTQTPRGWSFVFRGERYEYPTREQAQEALYDLQHGKAGAPALAVDLAEDDTRLARRLAVFEQLAALPEDERNAVIDEIEAAIKDTIARQQPRLSSVIITTAAGACAGEEAETPNIRAAGSDITIGYESDITIGYEGEPDYPATVTEVWHSATTPIVVVLSSADELWVLHRDEWGSQAPASPIRVERPADMPCPCTEYHAPGGVFIEVLDSPEPGDDGLSVWNMGGDQVSLESAEKDARDLLTLLSDPRVQAAIEARRAA